MSAIEPFELAVRQRGADRLRAVFSAHPELRATIDRPLLDTAPAIVFCRDTLLDFGANINVRSDWWAGGFGVLDDNTPEMRAYLIERGALPLRWCANRG